MLFRVKVNGETHIVDAPSKATAGAWAAKQVKFEIEQAGAGDIKAHGEREIPTILPRGKEKGAEGAAAEGSAEGGAPTGDTPAADETAAA